MIIDTHLHIWNPALVEYDWLDGAPLLLNQTYEWAQVADEAQQSGVNRAILIQAANSTYETHYLLKQAAGSHSIAGVVGWIDLAQPSQAEAQLNQWQRNPLFKGVRHLIHNEKDEQWLLQKPVLESLNLLALRQLPFDLVGTTSQHLDCALAIAESIPALSLVIDHLHQPPVSTVNAASWTERMRRLASYSNVTGKISGLGTALQEGLNVQEHHLRKWIEFAFQHFGPQRLLLGSDWPVCLLAETYHSTMNRYTQEIVRIASPWETSLIFHQNAERIYRL
jgi:L-fuconolactonase